MFTEGTTEVRRSPGDVPVSVPVLFTGRAETLEEILGGQNFLPPLPAVGVVKMTIVVINFLIGEYCLDGVHHSQLPVVSSGGVRAAGMIGQTRNYVDKILNPNSVFSAFT